jgi:hypothetical protein
MSEKSYCTQAERAVMRNVIENALDVNPNERKAEIAVTGWGGTLATTVLVVGETPQKYRIRAIERTRLAGRNRWLDAGQETLVPKRVVKFTP